MSATKDREINIRRHTHTQRESIAEGCASLLYLAAVLSPLSTCLSLLSFYVSLSVCRTIFFPGAPPPGSSSSLPRVHLRPSDTNGQSKLRHYEVPGAEVTPLYGATHHFGAAIPHVGETPLGFSRRERDPLLPPPLSFCLALPERKHGHRRAPRKLTLSILPILTFAKITWKYTWRVITGEERS